MGDWRKKYTNQKVHLSILSAKWGVLSSWYGKVCLCMCIGHCTHMSLFFFIMIGGEFNAILQLAFNDVFSSFLVDEIEWYFVCDVWIVWIALWMALPFVSSTPAPKTVPTAILSPHSRYLLYSVPYTSLLMAGHVPAKHERAHITHPVVVHLIDTSVAVWSWVAPATLLEVPITELYDPYASLRSGKPLLPATWCTCVSMVAAAAATHQ